MLGNRFHDPGTPPPIILPGIGQLGGNSPVDTPTNLSDIDESDMDTIPNLKKLNTIHTMHSNTDGTGRRPSHTDHAIEIVESITRQDTALRRPSVHQHHTPHRRGILANLLKLDIATHQQQQDQQENQPTARRSGLVRPVHHLRSFASSKSLKFSSFGRDVRHSLNLDDIDLEKKAAATSPEVTAQRMKITAEIADVLERQELIIKLGKALVRTGAPSHRIEAALEKTSKRLEINGSYFVLPGLIMVSFGDDETHTSETHLIKCAKSLDLAKLATVNDIAHQVSKGRINVAEANALLDSLQPTPTWGFWMTLLGYVLSSAFIAPLFFGGSWTDCWVSGIFGLCVGIATFISERIPMLGNVFEMVLTIVVSVVVLALNPYVCYLAVSLSAIVVALPGYSLTSAVMELSARNLCSGTVHLAHALMYVLFLAFGMSYGSGIWSLTHGADLTSDRTTTDSPLQTCIDPVNPYWYFLILPLTCAGILICYGGNMRQYPGFTLNSAVGFVLYYFLNKILGTSTSASNIVSSVSAFAIGLVSNIYARVTNKPSNHMHFAIVILVPGSLGVRGAFSLFDGSGAANGSDFMIQIIGVALSITLGLFLANVFVYPTGRKRAVFLGF